MILHPQFARRPRLVALATATLMAIPAQAQFGPEAVIDAAGPDVRGVHAADLDGDGDEDVLVCRDSAPTLAWYENLGSGAFGPAQPLPAQPDRSLQALTLDLGDDGDLDVLAISDYYTPELGTDIQLEWFVNDGGGGFSSGLPLAFGSPEVCTLGDLEGDGDLDVFWVDWPSTVYVVTLENGVFGPAQLLTDQLVGARDLAAADLDGDGDGDLVAAEYAIDQVSWLENPGAAPFGPKLALNTQADGALGVHAADVDGDGDLDPLSSSSEGFDKEVHWYRNLGGGAFDPAIVVTTVGNPGADVVGKDLDGDGDADLLAIEFGGASWYENDGVGGFGPRRVIRDEGVAGGVALGDLNGDGAPDVVIGTRVTAAPRVVWYANGIVGPLGRSYCGPAVPNSTGQPGVASAHGSYFVGVNDVELAADQLPPDHAGLFAASQTVGFTPNLGGGMGTLCMGGSIRRLLPAQSSGPAGSFTLEVDLATALGAPVLPGESWSFQAWHRDVGGTSNLTDAVRVTFAP